MERDVVGKIEYRKKRLSKIWTHAERSKRRNSRNKIHKSERVKGITVIQVFVEVSNKLRRWTKTEREEAEYRKYRQC